MQHIFGIILHGNDSEILESESPEKGSYMGLQVAIIEGQKRMKLNPSIKQINIYSIKQGQRILDYILPSTNEPVR